jgi:FAD/FMN-containing dehydrogenase
VADGALCIDLRPMSAVRVDVDAQRAWVQGGATLGNLDRATQAHGLATTAGNVSHTGVGGLTLGGGMGWLARQYGLACDNVEAYRVVTADGERVRAAADENADLFWGLRGGGGNFGVVTEFEFRIHPVGTQAVIADLFFRPNQARAALRGWRDLLPDTPREATLTSWFGTTGDEAFLPAELRGQELVSIGFVWVGGDESASTFHRRLRQLGSPIAERFEPITYLGLQTRGDANHAYGKRRYWKGHLLAELPDEAIDAYLERESVHPDPAFRPSGDWQSYGGAIGDVADEDSAFSHREAAFEFLAISYWSEAADDADRMAAARRYASALEPFASGTYLNSLADRGAEEVGRAYRPAKLDRLAQLKRRYDPDNVFHYNHNIAPAPESR